MFTFLVRKSYSFGVPENLCFPTGKKKSSFGEIICFLSIDLIENWAKICISKRVHFNRLFYKKIILKNSEKEYSREGKVSSEQKLKWFHNEFIYEWYQRFLFDPRANNGEVSRLRD